MIKLLLCTLMFIGLQTVRAEEAPATPDTTTTASDSKSFFESQTLEDVQQLVHIDTSFTDGSTDMSSTSGGAG